MISVFLMGGLGNQLYQIFAAFAYAIQYNTKLLLPYDEVLNIGHPRPTYWRNFLNSLSIFTTANPSNKLSNIDLYQNCNKYQWLDHSYKEIPNFGEQNVILYGYFQSPKYFREYENQIFRMIRLEDMKESIKTEYAYYFSGNIHTISMHFRVGDYKDNPNHPVLEYDYYKTALNIIASLVEKDIRVLYFCEETDVDLVEITVNKIRDHEKTKENGHIKEFIRVENTISDWKQMLIMSLCNSNIIANSTFSWWGAYFAEKNKGGRIVCYPEKWFSGGLIANDMSNMFPDEWIRI
jgi:hypothetical protein